MGCFPSSELYVGYLDFDAIAAGVTTLGITVNALGDANGDPLLADVTSGSITVTAVPEPITFGLFGIGALGLIGYGWRRRRQVA